MVGHDGQIVGAQSGRALGIPCTAGIMSFGLTEVQHTHELEFPGEFFSELFVIISHSCTAGTSRPPRGRLHKVYDREHLSPCRRRKPTAVQGYGGNGGERLRRNPVLLWKCVGARRRTRRICRVAIRRRDTPQRAWAVAEAHLPIRVERSSSEVSIALFRSRMYNKWVIMTERQIKEYRCRRMRRDDFVFPWTPLAGACLQLSFYNRIIELMNGSDRWRAQPVMQDVVLVSDRYVGEQLSTMEDINV